MDLRWISREKREKRFSKFTSGGGLEKILIVLSKTKGFDNRLFIAGLCRQLQICSLLSRETDAIKASEF